MFSNSLLIISTKLTISFITKYEIHDQVKYPKVHQHNEFKNTLNTVKLIYMCVCVCVGSEPITFYLQFFSS